MAKRVMWLTLVVFMVTITSGYAAGLELAVGAWQQNPSGDLGYKAEGSSDIIDFTDDLDYESENRVVGRLKIDMPLMFPNIYLVAAPMDFEGTGQKNVNFTFGDTTFSANADVDSELTLNQYDVAFYYGIPGIKTATADKLNIEIGLNARIIDFYAKIQGESSAAPGVTVKEDESLMLALPMLYAGIQINPVKQFAIEAEARGISIGSNSLYSLIGRVRLNLSGPVFVAAGYRYDKFDIDEQDVVLDVEFSGPFAEVGIDF